MNPATLRDRLRDVVKPVRLRPPSAESFRVELIGGVEDLRPGLNDILGSAKVDDGGR